MTKDAPIRRGTRARKPSEKALANMAQAHVVKRRSPRIAQLAKEGKRANMVDIPVERRAMVFFFDDDDDTPPSSESDEEEDEDNDATDSEDDSEEDEDEDFEALPSASPAPEERMHLTREDFEYMAAYPLDRSASVDSRHQDGNEEYERDSFVASDSDSDECEANEADYDDEITLASSSEHEDEDMHDEEQYDDDDELTLVPTSSHPSAQHSPRTSPQHNGRAIDDATLPIALTVPPSMFPAFPPEDVAEEINDAVTRFLRRCNRNTPVFRATLDAAAWADEEVREAVERAVREGVGRYVEEAGGEMVGVRIGPRGM